MSTLAIPLGALLILVAWFAFERFRHDRALEKIPLRICITGTRGKSTVTRFIAAALRESGRRVVAKTTGSKPVVIMPDGGERDVPRIGIPSILEQKRVVRLARALAADALVVEMMSIRPETLEVESRKLLRPHVLALTNVRLDHIDDMGRTKGEVAASLAAAIPAQGTIIVAEEEFYPVFERVADERAAKIIRVRKESAEAAGGLLEFAENRRLALAVAEFCGIRPDVALRGLNGARPDFGAFRIWKAERPGRALHFASAFAANEPESTALVLAALRRRPGLSGRPVALLNLRADRGDRTRQWLDAARAGFFDEFDHLVFIGDHARPLARKSAADFGTKARVGAVSGRDPVKIMDAVFALSPEAGLVVGMGNMGGAGEALVAHWAAIGAPA